MPRACIACTFINEDDARSVCMICGTRLPPVQAPVVEDQEEKQEEKQEQSLSPEEMAKAEEDRKAEEAQKAQEAAKAEEDAKATREAMLKAIRDAEAPNMDYDSDEDEPDRKDQPPAVQLEGKEGALRALLGTATRDFLVDNCGQQVPLSTLDNKIVGIYFSAHWCPPCRGFTPRLARIYRHLQSQGQPFEIVFVSSDQSEAEFKSYHGSMPWLALPYDERSLKDELSQRFRVRGIPSLILMDEFGKVFTDNGRSVVMEEGPEAFPWRPDPAIAREARATFFAELKTIYQMLDTKQEGSLSSESLKGHLQEAKLVPDADTRASQIIKDVTRDGAADPTQEAWIAYFEGLVKLNDDEIFSLNVLKQQFGLAGASDV